MDNYDVIERNKRNALNNARVAYENECDAIKAEAKEQQIEAMAYSIATKVRALYNAYIGVGFTETQAWELCTIMVSGDRNGPKKDLSLGLEILKERKSND